MGERVCRKCDGRKVCPSCNGAGKVYKNDKLLTTDWSKVECKPCRGSGACPGCSGRGYFG
jgi:DnaJ-class molecular chaperone